MSSNAEYRLRLLVESMVREGHDEKTITAAVRAADDRPVSESRPLAPARALRPRRLGRRAAA
jgi:hypothetical protein